MLAEAGSKGSAFDLNLEGPPNEVPEDGFSVDVLMGIRGCIG
jgi:hypothetical protein